MKNNHYLYYCHQLTALTPDIAQLNLIPVDKSISYQAGQYVHIELAKGLHLPLSIANAPSSAGMLEFHLRHNQTHMLAQQFLNTLTQSKSVTLSGPFGDSTLQQATSQQKLLFVAGGTGFAPIKALLQSALPKKTFERIELYWGICRPIDAYEEKLLQQWQLQYPHFHYTLVLSEPEQHPSWTGATGLVHAFCASQYPNLENYCVFLSGPAGMIKQAKIVFNQQNSQHYKLVSDFNGIE